MATNPPSAYVPTASGQWSGASHIVDGVQLIPGAPGYDPAKAAPRVAEISTYGDAAAGNYLKQQGLYDSGMAAWNQRKAELEAQDVAANRVQPIARPNVPQPTFPAAEVPQWEPNRPTATAQAMQPSSVSGSPGLINWTSMGQPNQRIATTVGAVQRPDRPAMQLTQTGLVNSQMGVTSFDQNQSRQMDRQQETPGQNPSYMSNVDLELLNRQRQGSVIDRFGVYNPNFPRT